MGRPAVVRAVPMKPDLERDKQRRKEFREDLRSAINRNSIEQFTGTPDFILADYLMDCLDAYESLNAERSRWRLDGGPLRRRRKV